MPLTLISHFWNEEFLLPYWLRHHYPLFDHGILLDYASTDRSVAIAQELAPNWEIRPSKNAWFDARDVDAEVMAVERTVNGWKMILNTTEFLLCSDLASFVRRLEEDNPSTWGVWPFDLTIVDRLAERENEVTEAPLFFQKWWGYHSQGDRTRLLHRYPDGDYTTGRHNSNRNPGTRQLEKDLLLLWFGWCPMRYIKQRKLQIQQRIPQRDRLEGLGKQHMINSEGLEAAYLKEAGCAHNLFATIAPYRTLIHTLAQQANFSLPTGSQGLTIQQQVERL